MDTGSSIDAMVTGAFALLAAAAALSGAVLLFLGRTGQLPLDAVATEIGTGTTDLGRLDDDRPADAALVVVPMRRGSGRERDVEAFLNAAAEAQERVERAVTAEQAVIIDATQRIRRRRDTEG